MNRAQKQESIESVHATLKAANIALVVHNNGLTVAQMSELRRKMREAGAQFKVSKNRLAKIAAKDFPPGLAQKSAQTRPSSQPKF